MHAYGRNVCPCICVCVCHRVNDACSKIVFLQNEQRKRPPHMNNINANMHASINGMCIMSALYIIYNAMARHRTTFKLYSRYVRI